MSRRNTFRRLALSRSLSLGAYLLLAGCATSTPLSVCPPQERGYCHPTCASALDHPGTDAELPESGITPADILAYAQNYGQWVRNNLAQLNGLLDLREQD
ncbi:hypothetical protein [Pseudomonas fluorescens]|uniref:hypothetical protein n=1 Tax=Pseudomonas fluorescens TaxID=294 RepID=UPI001BEB9395|nr:hypothetical protein [Pseudomonas fluorescens]MBT2375480.1 hypothetical protein [Pseudomonas fluorescens]